MYYFDREPAFQQISLTVIDFRHNRMVSLDCVRQAIPIGYLLFAVILLFDKPFSHLLAPLSSQGYS